MKLVSPILIAFASHQPFDHNLVYVIVCIHPLLYCIHVEETYLWIIESNLTVMGYSKYYLAQIHRWLHHWDKLDVVMYGIAAVSFSQHPPKECVHLASNQWYNQHNITTKIV